jgi:hypothetical protein
MSKNLKVQKMKSSNLWIITFCLIIPAFSDAFKVAVLGAAGGIGQVFEMIGMVQTLD